MPTTIIATGASLGPTYITAAYIDSTGKLVIVASIEGNAEYCAFMVDSAKNEGVKIRRQGSWYIRDGERLVPIPPEPKYNPSIEGIFTTALRTIHEETMSSLGKAPDITSVSIPSHLNHTSGNSACKAVKANEKGIIRPWQVRRKYNAIRLAYGLNSCEGFSLDPDTCDIDEDLPGTLFIDYNMEYLGLTLANMGEYLFGINNSVRLYELGAKWLNDSEEAALRKYQHEVQEAFKIFKDRNNVRQQNFPTDIEYISAIVMSGDVPKSAFSIIRDVVSTVLPEHKDKVRNSIDPLFTEAVGAAQWAKLQVLKAEILQDISVHPHYHDEL